MADDQNELRRINWGELFSWTHIFKTFRMATHLSKLALAMAAIVLVFLGGTLLDAVWSVAGQNVHPQEITAYVMCSPDQFQKGVKDGFPGMENWKDRDARLAVAASVLADAQKEKHDLNKIQLRSYLTGVFADQLKKSNDEDKTYKIPDAGAILEDARKTKKDPSALLDDAKRVMNEGLDRAETLIKDSFKPADEKFAKDESLKSDDAKDRAKKELEAAKTAAWRQLTDTKQAFMVGDGKNPGYAAAHGTPIFSSLLSYEDDCLSKAIRAVRYGNILGGTQRYQQMLQGKNYRPASVDIPSPAPLGQPAPADDPDGFVVSVAMMLHGLGWLVCVHYFYAIPFLAWGLVVIGVFVGAIYRAAALHAAREEKISFMQALKFSLGKALSFITAPLLPVAIILVFGGVLALGGLLLGTWGGGILLGVLFFVALILGTGIAFLLVGLSAGGGLMYPTIAVEGSDSFDAISRSFSYVLSRPWRTAWYGLVSLVYGVITYLFVRLFVFLSLAATHCFLKWGVFGGGERISPDADKLDVLWQAPTFDSLWNPANSAATSVMEPIGAFIIGVWVFLMAAMTLAYIISYVASSSTVVYLLLRQKVDATDMDDVYIDEAEDVAPASPAVAPATVAPAVEAKPAETIRPSEPPKA